MDNALKGGQNVSRSYQHAMRAPDQSVDDARRQAGQFLDKRISEAAAIQAGSGEKGVSSRALSPVGDAIHLATDSVSPSHVGFQVWAGLGRPFEAYLHTMGEDAIISVDMGAAVAAARAIFEAAFGAELLAHAIEQANAGQEAQDKANKTLGVFANSGCWFFGSCGVSH